MCMYRFNYIPLRAANLQQYHTGTVTFGRRDEFVVEPEVVEERPQARVVVVAEALVRPERVRRAGERLPQMLGEHVPVRNVVRRAPQAVHVVGEHDQTGRDVAEMRKRVPRHRRPRDLAEGADVGQPRRAVAGLEQDVALGVGTRFEAVEKLARLLERPRLAVERRMTAGPPARGALSPFSGVSDRNHLTISSP